MNLRVVYLARNLTRNLRRTLLTAAAVGLPIVIYVLSTAVVDGFEHYLENSARQLRLAVTHKASLVNYLPAAYRARIQALDPGHQRILSVCGLRWIGGQVDDNPLPLSTLAVDHDAFLPTFPEYKMTPDQLAQWNRDRQAIIIGRSTAEKLGWTEGQRITIRPSLPPYTNMEFHVVMVPQRVPDAITNFCRSDYFEEELKKNGYREGMVGFYFVKCASKEDLDFFRQAIDAEFANSPDETRTQDEKAFMNEFVTQQFNLPRNLMILASVTVFVAIMAAANTMSMNFRDRLNELATLKAVGFSRGFMIALVQCESLLICAIGGLAGALIPYLAFMHSPLKRWEVPIIQSLEIAPRVCLWALAISLGIGLIAGLWPAWSAARMKTVDALRGLE